MQDRRERTPKRKSGSASWIGFLIFLMLAVGPQIINVVSRIVNQITGGVVQLGPNILPMIIGGLIMLTVFVSVGRSLWNMGQQNETRLPTSTPSSAPVKLPQPSSPPMQNNQPTLSSYGVPSQESTLRQIRRSHRGDSHISMRDLPSAPHFEPIISGKVLVWGILGLVAFVSLLGMAFMLAGILTTI